MARPASGASETCRLRAGGFKNIELIRRPWPNEATSTVQSVIDLNSSRMLQHRARSDSAKKRFEFPTFPRPARGMANVSPYYNAAAGTFSAAVKA